jgi:hypothetical protein
VLASGACQKTYAITNGALAMRLRGYLVTNELEIASRPKGRLLQLYEPT